MLKEVHVPHLGRTVKMGRRRPVSPHPRMALTRRLLFNFASPPSADYSKPAAAILSDIMGNDAEGDCVPAGFNHILGVETANAGAPYHSTLAQVNAEYGAIGGYVPGDPSTDNGCDENTADQYYQHHGFANGTKSLGSVQLDPTSQNVVQAGIYLFENAIFGVELPDAWVNPFPAGDGFVWDVAGDPVPENGHCFVAVGYTASGVLIDSWGMIGTITWAAVAKYCASSASGQLFSIVTPDQLTKGQSKAPSGVSWTDIITTFDAMGGTPLLPIPAPPPPPPNPSTPTATLAQAIAWATTGLEHANRVLLRGQAEKIVANALTAAWPKK